MNKIKSKKELNIDFLGGEELTTQEELDLKKFFANQKIKRQRKLIAKSKKSKDIVK